MIPYNLLPIETHVAMINAELTKVPELHQAAAMWTEVRGWIEAAQAQLRTRIGNLTPEWKDRNGRELEEQTQRSLAELKMWGERIDASQVSQALTTLAGTIPAAHAAVTAAYSSYCAAMANPLTMAGAAIFHQASATAMNALGGHFDTSMLSVCGAAGAASPQDLVPGMPKFTGATPEDLAKSAAAAASTMQDLKGLASSVGVGSGSGSNPDLSALQQDPTTLAGVPGHDPSSGGVSLAGLVPGAVDPSQLAAGSPGGLPFTGVPDTGTAPTPTGSLGMFGVAGGQGVLPTGMRPTAGKRSTPDQEVRAGNAASAAKPTSGGSMPPMMPQTGQSATAGVLRPGSQPIGRSGNARKPATGAEGIATGLRGRSGTADPHGFTLPRPKPTPETDHNSLQLLDEDLWRIHPA